ncbi:odorant receptor 13a-like [Episyrphus balteatus]|uniref:odorant receptor 13a-like n=1 Tax=Episyrphus balteatus TaxID=286459 RepID=UPI0024857AA9|nr:odorant receptor 13a-like [Episyrphus balteatus]
MNLFVPVTAKGEEINLIQFWFFKFSWLWPLASNSPKYDLVLVNLLALLGLSCFVGTVYAEFLFMNDHEGDLAKIAECLCTTFIGTQFIIRILHLMFRRHQMRDVLKKFYGSIYVPKSENEQLHIACEKSLRLVYFMSFTFFVTLSLMFTAVGLLVIGDPHSRTKPYLYKMRFAYDSQDPWNYAFTTLYTGWVGFASVTLIAAQDCFIGTTLTYCAARYDLLQNDLDTLYERSIRSFEYPSKPLQDFHKVFRRKLGIIIQKQQDLDRFMPDLQSFVSVTLFVLISFGVFLLCVLAFQLAKNDLSIETLKYFFWLVSQCLEFVVVGSFGQRCTDAAAKMANSYYMCNWESLLDFGDVKANAELIRDISFAIYRSQKSVHLNGMKFVILSLSSIGSAMSSSVSYFMFLNTMEDISSKRNGNK